MTDFLNSFLERLDTLGTPIQQVEKRKATLEEVFLHLTGQKKEGA